MHEYDIAFKLTLQQVDVALRELIGTTIARWLNVELPEVRNTRVDLLGETAAGELVHIELQSSNHGMMALRMAEYCLRVFRLFGRFPQQVLLYVGEAEMRMEAELHGPALDYSYRLVDIRELDGEQLLGSSRVGDNIVAILTRLKNVRETIDRILQRIGELEPGEREEALTRLLILSELRDLGERVEEEARKMPILNDILDHKVLGREYKKGRQEGIQEGRQEGIQEGRQEGIQEGRQEGRQEGIQQGELTILRRQIEKRFGATPSWAEERLAQLSTAELEKLSERVLDASSLEDLLKS